MEDKFIVNSKQRFGFEILSPDFEEGIKVTFAKDMSADQRVELRDLEIELNKLKELGKKDSKKYKDLFETYSLKLFEILVIDWNLFNENEEKLPVKEKSLDLLSTQLRGWIIEKAMDFLGVTLGKTKN